MPHLSWLHFIKSIRKCCEAQVWLMYQLWSCASRKTFLRTLTLDNESDVLSQHSSFLCDAETFWHCKAKTYIVVWCEKWLDKVAKHHFLSHKTSTFTFFLVLLLRKCTDREWCPFFAIFFGHMSFEILCRPFGQHYIKPVGPVKSIVLFLFILCISPKTAYMSTNMFCSFFPFPTFKKKLLSKRVTVSLFLCLCDLYTVNSRI